MEEQVKKLKELIESSERILITSHISPDPDAVSSLLLAGATLSANFPDKKISMVLEEEPLDLEFLTGYQDIEVKKLQIALDEKAPQLLIIVDANNFNRVSRLDGDEARVYVQQNKVKTAIIDHHEPANKDNTDVFINRMQPASVQTIYEVMLNEMGLKPPAGAVDTAMTGFYSDTGGFVYLKSGAGRDAFAFAEELVDSGANIEAIKNKLYRFTEAEMKVFAELARNISHDNDHSFSYISDAFSSDWLEAGNSQSRLQKAAGIFLDGFIRNIDGRKWGFIVYKNNLQGEGMYSASFRSSEGAKDVASIANKLGGGGHKPAAGAKFPAASVGDALQKVKNAI